MEEPMKCEGCQKEVNYVAYLEGKLYCVTCLGKQYSKWDFAQRSIYLRQLSKEERKELILNSALIASMFTFILLLAFWFIFFVVAIDKESGEEMGKEAYGEVHKLRREFENRPLHFTPKLKKPTK